MTTPSTDPTADPIPSSVREVIAFFASELDGQRFGDLDAATLEDLAEQAREKARVVESAREALEDAQSALNRAREELGQRTEQALGYAKVFASDNDALSARLNALEGPKAATPKRKAKRARKARAEEPRKAEELPFEEARAGAA